MAATAAGSLFSFYFSAVTQTLLAEAVAVTAVSSLVTIAVASGLSFYCSFAVTATADV